MKKPDILNQKPENSVTEPKEDEFKSKLDISDLDAEQITGGTVQKNCVIVL